MVKNMQTIIKQAALQTKATIITKVKTLGILLRVLEVDRELLSIESSPTFSYFSAL